MMMFNTHLGCIDQSTINSTANMMTGLVNMHQKVISGRNTCVIMQQDYLGLTGSNESEGVYYLTIIIQSDSLDGYAVMMVQ